MTTDKPFQFVSADKALEIVKSFNHIFVHTASMAPTELMQALANRHEELREVQIYHLHIEGEAPYADEKYKDSFFINSLFVGKNVRKTFKQGNGSIIPVMLSEIPSLFRNGIIPIDVALIQVSVPDDFGYCSLGINVDVVKQAVQSATKVIALINPQVPRTHGDSFIHISNIDFMVEAGRPIYASESRPLNDIYTNIGQHVSTLIEDGSTLQMGIGAIPDAVVRQLHNHKDLGIHSEMISDGIIQLAEKGIINGSKKTQLPGKIVCGFAIGSRRLHQFIDNNPLFSFQRIDWVNNPVVIRKNPKVVAINSAIEVDVTGQVCADSIGSSIYSGVGGQADFIRGAAFSRGGVPIIALPSVTNNGESRIVPFLKQGAGVTTPRSDVHFVVTEYGIANLYGKNIKQRVMALAAIAHPLHSESILKAYFDAVSR